MASSRSRPSPLISRLVLAALLVAAMPARADMLFGNAKKVGLSIHVDAEPPPGRAVVLLGTLTRAETIPVGVPHSFNYYWKNHEPGLELYLLPAARLPELAEFKRWNNEDEIHALLRGAIACGSPFMAERVLSGSSPAVEVRYRYRLHTADGACEAEFLSIDHLDASGTLVHRDTTAPPPGVTLADCQFSAAIPRPEQNFSGPFPPDPASFSGPFPPGRGRVSHRHSPSGRLSFSGPFPPA